MAGTLAEVNDALASLTYRGGERWWHARVAEASKERERQVGVSAALHQRHRHGAPCGAGQHVRQRCWAGPTPQAFYVHAAATLCAPPR